MPLTRSIKVKKKKIIQVFDSRDGKLHPNNHGGYTTFSNVNRAPAHYTVKDIGEPWAILVGEILLEVSFGFGWGGVSDSHGRLRHFIIRIFLLWSLFMFPSCPFALFPR